MAALTNATKPTAEQYNALFRKEWTDERIDKPAHDWSFYFLRILGLAYITYFLIAIVGAFGQNIFPGKLGTLIQMMYANVPLAINSYGKLSIMALLAMIGAYNRELRFHTSILLLVGHLTSTVATFSLYLVDAPTTPYRAFLSTSAIVDLLLSVGLTIIIFQFKGEATRYKIQKEFPEFYSLANRLTVMTFQAIGILFLAAIPMMLLFRFLANGENGFGAVYGFPDPVLCNSLAKNLTLGFLCLMVARREELRNMLYPVLLTACTVSMLSSIAWLLFGSLSHPIVILTRNGTAATADWYFMLNVAVDSLLLSTLLGVRRMFYNVEYSITCLNPASARNVVSLHEALHDTSVEDHGAILQRIDRHAANVRGRKRGLLNFPFTLLEFLPNILSFKPPFSTMSREECRYILRYQVLRTPAEQKRSILPPLADLLFKLGNACHALITLAHYSHIKSWEETGYVPADARDRLQGELTSSDAPFNTIAELPQTPTDPRNFKPDTPANTQLVAPRLVTPVSEPSIPDVVDYLIVGSGAGGAVMAYRLACAEPTAKILVVERGPRYSPLQDFNDDEMDMVRKLYKEGGLQQTKRFDLMILQGECMGGTTVINNAVCFPMPDHIRERWQNEYDIDLSKLDHYYAQVASEIDIDTINNAAINQRVADVFHKGIEGLNAQGTVTKPVETLKANQRNMLGEGLCNIGNKRMRKRSMLETYIPWAEARGVQFLPETSAVRFYHEGNRATGVLLRSDLGQLRNVRVNKAVVASGGVIASSHFLMRSDVGKNVGERLSCNFAFPVAFEFEQELKAYDGVQITLGALDPSNRAVFETYFNPPGAFAISLPFYFDTHKNIMDRYSHLINFGSLVGSEAMGTIDPKANILDGRAFSWDLGEQDRNNIKYALSTLVQIGKHAGATKAILPFEPGIELDLHNDQYVTDFTNALATYPLQMADLRLTTAHPQGGNGMAGARSPHASQRVVDEQFRVVGFENVYVADASVFPTGITVNPQWTIMALSSIAAEYVTKTPAASVKTAWPPTATAVSTSSLPWLFNNKQKARA